MDIEVISEIDICSVNFLLNNCILIDVVDVRITNEDVFKRYYNE